MAKRFIDTTIWTQNKWFRKLSPKNKLLWFYLISNCDAVGVWEEDFELASFIIGDDFKKDEINKEFEGKLKWINAKKIWILDFCDFQYGKLIEENLTNKPHQSYINLLKKHSLWIDYTKTIKSLKEKDKDKDKDKDKEKENIPFEVFWNLYNKKLGSKDDCEKKWKKLKDKERQSIIDILPEYKRQFKDRQFQPYPATFLNQRRWENEIIRETNNNSVFDKYLIKDGK